MKTKRKNTQNNELKLTYADLQCKWNPLSIGRSFPFMQAFNLRQERTRINLLTLKKSTFLHTFILVNSDGLFEYLNLNVISDVRYTL